ncbi:kinase-like domain-containing protein, partial [Mycena pura]
QRLKRETDVWSKLRHKNVLPFIGVCGDIAPSPVLISPFYKFGHVGAYIRKFPATNRNAIVLGVASGLQFLHDNEIVHGDLKVQNVLIDKHGTPCICDFGISKIINSRGFTTGSVGTAPYMAPELLVVIDAERMDTTPPSTTKSSDVYSFSLLVLEVLCPSPDFRGSKIFQILTSAPPKGRPTKPVVSAKVLEGLRPKRADYDVDVVTNEVWAVLDRSWEFDPQMRPSIAELSDSLSFLRCDDGRDEEDNDDDGNPASRLKKRKV